MPSYLISGPSGSGKSTLGAELQSHGYRVIDTDHEPGLSAWVKIADETKVTDFPPQPYPETWVRAHKWAWDTTKMDELLSSAGDLPLFFCGGAHNERDFYGGFEKRFGLWVDDAVLTQRLQPREPERWVEGSAELAKNLEWNRRFKEFCVSTGAIVLDSSVSPSVLADMIIEHIAE